MRRTTGVALALALVLCTTVACADSAPTAQGSSVPSPSPSPSVVCAGEPSVLAANSVRRRSEFVTEGDLDVLVIGDGEAICRDPADPDPAPGVTISMTFVRYGKPGARSTALEAAEPIGRYDGSAPLRVAIPVLGSPCTGAVVHVGTTLPDDLLPSSRPVTGVTGGPTIYDPTAALLAGGDDAITAGLFSPIIAIDNNGGPKCQVTLSVR